MIDLKQKELARWQNKNFSSELNKIEYMALGMAEEVGEICHSILKGKQGIREGADGNDLTMKIADDFADTVIFGIQLMSCLGLDAEQIITNTINNVVLKRDWTKSKE